MNDNYLLMHKDVACAVIAIDRDSGAFSELEIINKDYMPFLGNADKRSMKIWWEHRAVPGSRKEMEAIIRNAGCENSKGYLAKNLALSMTDTYWICPVEIELSWDDVNLYENRKTETNVVAMHNASSYDPNASLGGEMDKYWDVGGEWPILVKKAFRSYGQQSMNELFATYIHERQQTDIPFVSYDIAQSDDGAVVTRCEAFTNEEIEFVSAYEVLHSQKIRASRSEYDQYMEAIVENGLDKDDLQRYMDYLIMSDFVISNTDEHLQNFGLLRNTDSMQFVGPAPIFDSGNSMFFDVFRTEALNRAELLLRKINSFHNNEERMMMHVKDKTVFDVTKLPTPAEVEEFYVTCGLSAGRAAFIAGSYNNKIEMLRDF